MRKKNQGMSSERAAVYVQVQNLHAVSIKLNKYNVMRPVVVTLTDERRWLPKFMRPFFTKSRQLVGPYATLVLDEDTTTKPQILLVSDDTEPGEPVGAVALYQEKINEYVRFDFEHGYSEDFHIVKSAMEKKWKGIRNVISSAELRDAAEAKQPPNRHNTPH